MKKSILERKRSDDSRSRSRSKHWTRSPTTSPSRLDMTFFPSNDNNNNNNDNNDIENQYDMKRPVFDLYSLRSIRGDALTKYNTLNQSEPLRINLLLLITLSLLGLVFGSEDILGSSLTVEQLIGTISICIGTTTLFVRECIKRSNQLLRFERELKALDLLIQLPTNQFFADYPYEKPQRIGDVIKLKNARIIAIYGEDSMLRESMQMLQVLGNRLVQANTYVAVIRDDKGFMSVSTSLKDFLSENKTTNTIGRVQWLVEPTEIDAWKHFFQNTLSTGGGRVSRVATESKSSLSSFLWFGLSSTGRSFGSGTENPSWIQILGKSLSPVQDLEQYYPNESNNPQADNDRFISRNNGTAKQLPNPVSTSIQPENIAGAVRDTSGTIITSSKVAASVSTLLLEAQANFYKALIAGDMNAMREVVFGGTIGQEQCNSIDGYDDYNDSEVSSIVAGGGRLESWDRCLEVGARPTGMKVGNCDCFQLSETEAYTTAIEFPAVSTNKIILPTLLAVQKWKLVRRRSMQRAGVTITTTASMLLSSKSGGASIDASTGSSSKNEIQNGIVIDTDDDNDGTSWTHKWILQKHQTIPWTSNVPASGTLLCDCRGCVSLVRSI